MLRADGACGRQTASMTDADVAAAIGEHVRAFNDRDIDALMSGSTDDACWITGSSVARGRAELFTGAMTGLLPALARRPHRLPWQPRLPHLDLESRLVMIATAAPDLQHRHMRAGRPSQLQDHDLLLPY